MPTASSPSKRMSLPPHLKMIDHGVVAGDRASFLTSVQYHVAMAALMPDAPASVGLPDEPPDAVRSLMARITVKGDDALLADYPAVLACARDS